MVDGIGIGPMTSSMSTKRSTPELTVHLIIYINALRTENLVEFHLKIHTANCTIFSVNQLSYSPYKYY
jgi:hypothetical protein